MNQPPVNIRLVSWAVVYGLAAIVFLGFIAMGYAIYRQSVSNGEVADQIVSCTEPGGDCYNRAAVQRAAFAEIINGERHRDLAAAIVCAREHPKASVRSVVSCIERYEAILMRK